MNNHVYISDKIKMNNTESTNRERALQLWTSFRDEVMYNHRFYPSHPVQDKLAVFAKQNELTVKPGEIYYRDKLKLYFLFDGNYYPMSFYFSFKSDHLSELQEIVI